MPRDAAALAWLANLACLELHPHPVRADDLEHPDELRVDLDPVPGVEWDPGATRWPSVVEATLSDFGLIGWPKTSGSRGLHVIVRIERRWSFDAGSPRGAGPRARGRAASAGDRHQQVVEGGAPRGVRGLQPERQGPHRRLGLFGAAETGRAGLGADQLGRARRAAIPRDFTLATMPARFAAIGDPHAAIDDHPGSLESLLELSARHEREGLGDAPWPPHYEKQEGEPQAGAAVPGGRASKHPLIEIGRAQRKEDALAGLERWKARHAEAAAHLEPADVLVDAMRGRFSTWTRIRVNLQHVPAELRPAQEPLDPDEKTLAELVGRG